MSPGALAVEDAQRRREAALPFRTLATLRTDIPLFDDVEALRWKGPSPGFQAMAAQLEGRGTVS